MREFKFKFKCWDKELFRMSRPYQIGDFGIKWENDDFHMPASFMSSKDRVVWLEYTGLLDKNGKEIYEGDAVYSSDDEEVYTIVFYKGMFCVRYPEGIFAPLYEFPEVVVCGNIFEP